MRHGFDLGYKTWVQHGESALPPPPPVIDNTIQPQMSDMIALLNDLSYIPSNNEHNELTQRDIGETSNEPTQATRNEFEELYVSANQELYPSCDYVTRLDLMAKFTYFKVKVCNTSRWKDSNTPGKKVPKKVLRYFLIIPRLQRLYKSSHTAKEMIWHAIGKCTEPGKMQHLVDGRAWKNFDTKYLDFAKEPRNIRLGLAADGFNPFANLSQAYSMWPMILMTYNLPSWLCMEESSFMPTLLIPGPKSPGKDIDVYLMPLIEDLKPLVDSAGNIRCPCKSCRLVLWVSIKHLSDHISKYGFDLSYKTWIHHGEADLPPPLPVIDNTRQPQMSDMTACLNELSYIPLNNEQNKPTQGDIGETSNDPNQANRKEFEELYASANEELYPGCDHVTRLDFMAKFTYFKAKGKLTDSIFNEMLEFFQNVFPTAKGYKLPPSYYAIKKTFKTIGLGYESIHACVNNRFLFRGDANKDVHFCSVCNTSRCKDSNTPGKKVPKKVLRYFSIIPRLQRLYKSSHTAKEMTWHATRKCTEPGKMQHPVDGKAWKDFDTKYSDFAVEPINDFDTKYSDFAAEPRNVRLGLAADGFNPFGNLSQSYSMWPVILTTYNLPPWLCMKESYFMLTLLIPGPKSPLMFT
nr:hypothetical protein [Tanacetum cinerariifolium]